MAGPSHNASKHPTTGTIKLLCSYGGKILPRYPDGKLRYCGGETRVLAVDRSLSFSELLVKLGELCGTPVALRCQLPTEDLDALVSITSDEDLVNLIEEYDRAATVQSSSSLKIRAFLSIPKKSSPSLSNASAHGFSSSATTALEIDSVTAISSSFRFLLTREISFRSEESLHPAGVETTRKTSIPLRQICRKALSMGKLLFLQIYKSKFVHLDRGEEEQFSQLTGERDT